MTEERARAMITDEFILKGLDLANVRLALDGRIPRVDPTMIPALMSLHPMTRHMIHHDICQAVYGRTKGDPPAVGDRTLENRGVVTLPRRIPGDLARRLSGFATEMLSVTLQKRGLPIGADLIPFETDDANTTLEIPEPMVPLFVNLLPLIFTPDVEGMLERYLQSHFRVDHCALYRTYPVNDPKVSFRWHRDLAPMGQVHVMLYLTDSGEESGATEFLDLADTRRMAEAGYGYVSIDDRLDDLSPLLKPGDPAPDIIRPSLAAGDAVMFAAPRCLHRGRVPKRGFRDVFLVVMLPSTASWRTEMEDLGVKVLSTDGQTYTTNPFQRGNPMVDELDLGRPTPEWAQLGQFGP